MKNDKSYSFSKKFVEGETLSGFWSLAFYGIVALNSFFIIKFLGVYEYGVYQLILSVMAVAESLTVGYLADMVLSDFSRYIGQGRFDLAKNIFRGHALVSFAVAVVIFAGVFFGADFLVGHYYDENIALFLKIAIIALLFRVGISILKLFFGGNIYFSALGAPVFGESAKFIVLVGLMLFQGLGIVQILIAYVLGHLFTFLFSLGHFFKVYKKLFFKVKRAEGSLIFFLLKNQGAWVGLRYVFSRIANNLRPWVIKFLLNTEAVAFFAFARNIMAVALRLMPLGTFGLLLPRELEDKAKLRYFFAIMVKYSFFLSLIFAVLIFTITPVLINQVFPKYHEAIPLIKIMSLIAILYGFYKVFRMTLVVLKEQKVLFTRSLDESILSPLLLFVLLPFFGVEGTAIEWVLTYGTTTVLFYCYLVKYHPYLKLALKTFYFTRNDIKFGKHIFLLAISQIKKSLSQSK